MMDVGTSVRQYIAEMLRVAGPGMKVLLMDRDTTPIVSCAYAQSEVITTTFLIAIFIGIAVSAGRRGVRP